MKKQLFYLSILISTFGFSQKNVVSVDLNTQKFIGEESDLSRKKYFSIHASYTDWGLAPESDYLFKHLGIEFGRAFSGPKPFNKKKDVDPKLSDAAAYAKKSQGYFLNSPMYKEHKTTDFIITDHPSQAFQLNKDYAKVAAYNVEYIKKGYPTLPKYYEIMNEPFVHAKDYVKTWAETEGVIVEMSKFHKVVADKIHAEVPNMLVGGYSAAWPEMSKNNFWHWNTRMKVFMDNAGESMDFFATHIYDGRNVSGDFSYRSGSNAEAILDLIEAYSYKKWGIVKPHLISEYGYTAKGLQGKPYSATLDGTCLVSYNNILMALMDKPDRLLKAVPFIVGKGSFFYTSPDNPEGHPYPWVIMRKLKNGSYKYTHMKKFYELWKDVEGKRVEIFSNNPDIQTNAFVKTGKAYIAINNLSDNEELLSLDFMNKSQGLIKNTTLRRLYTTSSGIPKLVYFTDISELSELTLKKGETVVLECDVEEYEFSKELKENNYYSKTYLQEIAANQSLSFVIENVEAGKKGRASLRMGIARAHNLSKAPKVTINGKKINVPSNWSGYDQAPREHYFGVIEIPFPVKYLKNGDNKVTLSFPDTGGHVSSIILNAEVLQ